MKYNIGWKWFLVALALGAVAWLTVSDLAVGATVFALALLPRLVAIYIPYAKDNPEHYWFKRKLYGWGWTPVTWQGWLVTLVFIALVVAFTLTIDENSPPREVAFTFALPAVLLTIAFIRLAYKKGESPRWQWGRDTSNEEKEDNQSPQ